MHIMAFERIKIFNIFILFMLVISACGTVNPTELVPEVETPGVSDTQGQPEEIEIP
jgi:hypothetical protein